MILTVGNPDLRKVENEVDGGVWTPGACFGPILLKRLLNSGSKMSMRTL